MSNPFKTTFSILSGCLSLVKGGQAASAAFYLPSFQKEAVCSNKPSYPPTQCRDKVQPHRKRQASRGRAHWHAHVCRGRWTHSCTFSHNKVLRLAMLSVTCCHTKWNLRQPRPYKVSLHMYSTTLLFAFHNLTIVFLSLCSPQFDLLAHLNQFSGNITCSFRGTFPNAPPF